MSLQGVLPIVMDLPAFKLPVRAFDERVRFTAAVAAAIRDKRDPEFTEHSVLSMVRQRMYGILADDEDQNDHTQLRSDPVFKITTVRQ